MEKITPERVEARTAMQFFSNVMEKVSQGYDICSPMFLSSDRASLNIYMVKVYCFYEYYLIEAETLKELDLKIERLNSLGYDFLHGVLNYGGTYLQWMMRMHESRESEAVSGQLSVVNDELMVVEDAQPVLKLAPVSLENAVSYLRGVNS